MLDMFWNKTDPAPRGKIETVPHPKTGQPYERQSLVRLIVSYKGWVGESWFDGNHWVKLPTGAEPDAWIELPAPAPEKT